MKQTMTGDFKQPISKKASVPSATANPSLSNNPYRGTTEDTKDEEDYQSEIVSVVTNASQGLQASSENNVLARLSTLSQKLSRRLDGSFELEIDPNDFDLRKILDSFVRNSKEQGIHHRSTGVVFKNVTTTGVDSEFSFAPTVRDLITAPVDLVKSFTKKQSQKRIVRDVTGVVGPGEMCLVLGRPGAGCSTLLKTIAGEQDQFIGVDGNIHYDGIEQTEMLKKYKGDLIYNGELDVHFPHITVDQTLRFAIACKTPHTRVNNVTREQYITAERDILATIFGLTHTYNTNVGNDYVRGVSGGERKRVSIAEAMAAKATVYCWDNATRGLDASTALEYAQAIRTTTNLTKSVAFITIYQAGENIYETFDKVLVLYEGRQVYFGKAENAKQYFVDLGFYCPPRQATADFLTAVTDIDGRSARPGYEDKVPTTADEFEQIWKNSKEYAALLGDISHYENDYSNTEETRQVFDKSLSQVKRKVHNRYTISYFQQLRLLTIRGFQRIWGDRAFTIIDTSAAIVESLVVGSLFWNTPGTTEGAFSRGGVIFFMVLYFSLIGLAEMALQFEERPILMKQKSYSFFHPSAEVIANTLTRSPIRFISVFSFYLITYFLSNMNINAGKFFMNLLFLTVTTETVSALFQATAALSQTAAAANSIAGVFILALVVYTGFMIQLKSMHPWFKWISYINPVRWGYESMLATEFQGRHMDCASGLIPSGPGFEGISATQQVCPFAGAELGQSWVSGDNYIKVQFSYSYNHVWRNLGFLFGFWILFLAINAIATEYKRAVRGGGEHLYFKRGAKAVQEQEIFMNREVSSSSPDDLESGTANEELDQTNHLTNLQKTKSSMMMDVFANLGSTGIFTWQNINYDIPYKGATRTLLHDVQGYVKPGTLTALMGESGAGKTTLLNVLSQRIDFGTVTGDFLVNGKPLDISFNRSTGYVQQQDLHIDELTVRESLIFAARLRRAKSVPDAEKLDYVEKIIKILGMELYADAIVGKIGSGLNVEQRKKLSIGVELVAKPSLLLFLDEPTSGLDSQSAWAIIQLLRRLAAAGQSILCTIHQPSATLFESFDRLLLLKKGGKTVYFGDIGDNSKTIVSYFERNGARPCDSHENPAEYILEAIGAGATASVKEDWYDIWTRSPEYEQTIKDVNYLKTKEYDNVADEESPKKDRSELQTTYALPYWDQLYFVVCRTGTQFYRDPVYIFSKLSLMLVSGLFIGFTFWDIKSSLAGLQNTMFVCFMIVIICSPAMNQIQERAIASRELFEVRESKSNTYHWSVLLLAQFLNELPYQLLFGTIFFCCCYFPLKIFAEGSRSGWFYFFYVIMFQLYFVSLSLMMVYFSPDLPSASVLTGLMLSFIVSFCGVLQPFRLMPGFWMFMYRVSPLTYYIQNLMSLVIHEKPVICAADEIAYFQPPQGLTCGEYAQPFINEITGYLVDPSATDMCGYCRYTVGDEYLHQVGVSFSYLWRNFGFFWVFIFFNLSAMCVLYYVFRVAKYNPVGYFRDYFSKRKI